MKKAFYRLIAFSFLFLTFISIPISAAGFVKIGAGDIFFDLNNSVIADKNTFPYNTKAKNRTSVGFDIRYGTERAKVQYTGEVPHYYAYDENGQAADGFVKLPYNNDRAAPHTFKKDNVDYWGSAWDEMEGVKRGELSADKLLSYAESGDSLRLYALTATKNRGLIPALNLSDGFLKFLAKMASHAITSIVVPLKGLSLTSITKAFKVGDVTKLIYGIFISNDGKLSIFAAICIMLLILAIVKFAFKYARGQASVKEFVTSIVVYALIGMYLVGASYNSESVSDLANTTATFTDKLVLSSMKQSSDTGIWVTETASTKRDTIDSAILATQISSINRLFIDVQICDQFGVKSVEELDFSQFGSQGTALAANLYGLKGETGKVGNNLGYYYWAANSGVSNLRDVTKVPKVGTHGQKRMTSMITYLQKCQNADSSIKQKNMNIINAFARPGERTATTFLMLAIVLVGLAIVLTPYAISIVLAKVSTLFSLLFMPVAGILILSANEKLVKYGKTIIGAFIVSIVELTAFTFAFDAMLAIITRVIAGNANIQSMSIALATTILFWFLRGPIKSAIKSTTDVLGATVAKDFKDFANKYSGMTPMEAWNGAKRLHRNRKHKKEAELKERRRAVEQHDRDEQAKKKIEIAERDVASKEAANIIAAENDMKQSAALKPGDDITATSIKDNDGNIMSSAEITRKDGSTETIERKTDKNGQFISETKKKTDKHGNVTTTETTRNRDGLTTTNERKTSKDGSKESKTVINKPEGAVETSSRRDKANGDVVTTNEKKAKDGSSKKVVTKTDKQGRVQKVETNVDRNGNGTQTTTKTDTAGKTTSVKEQTVENHKVKAEDKVKKKKKGRK